MRCTATYKPSAMWGKDGPALTCIRAVDPAGRHIGKHQAFETVVPVPNPHFPPGPNTKTEPWRRLWTWDESGAHGSSDFDDPGGNCMGCREGSRRKTHERSDHGYLECEDCGVVHDAYRSLSCDSCLFWNERAEKYAVTDLGCGQRFARPHDDILAHHPRMYAWSPGHGGAFGGTQFTVRWDDGMQVGPADFLWDNGRIPWWRVEEFPPNCVITQGDTVPRPGYTDAAGRPLRYTAYP